MKLAILSQEKEKIKTFLNNFGLKFQDQDYSFYIEDGAKIIGTVSVKGNIIQNFAVDPAYQGENLAGVMISEVLSFLQKRKIYYLQVYTNPKNKEIFRSLGFLEIISTEAVSLLESAHRPILRVLNEYKKEYNIDDKDLGCTVMNCNPFTFGHRYLIEEASKLHKRLLVFVVEEDSSFFSYRDRLRLVQDGTKDLVNVTVLPSSDYLVSSLTFPTYFLKEDVDEVVIQAKCDALIFRKYFLPIFGIKERYLGTETDPLTNKYNQVLKEVLEDKVVIMDRLKNGSEIISASLVRKLFALKDFESLKNLVPKTTLEFLKNYERDS